MTLASLSPPAPIPAERLLASWATFPRRQRLRFLGSAAESLSRLHLAGVNLFRVDLSKSACTMGSTLAFQLESPPHESPDPVRMDMLLQTLLTWRAFYRTHFSELEMAFFLSRFGGCAGVHRQLARVMLSEIMERDRRANAMAAVARHRASMARLPATGALWQDLPDAGLPDELEAAISAVGTRILKRAASSSVFATRLRGEDVVIKEFRRPSALLRRWRATIGPCKAARAWAVSRAMTECGISTPPALAFACRGGKSWVVTRWMTGWVTLRDWIKPRLHLRSEVERHAAEDLLLAAVTRLLDSGFWHADMKPSNLLVPAEGPVRVEDFLWIDLECVKPGTPPTRRRLLRNLAQLNGGIGRRLPREDRMRFLRRLSGRFPCLRGHGAARWIERTTRRRLLREVRRECGF